MTDAPTKIRVNPGMNPDTPGERFRTWHPSKPRQYLVHSEEGTEVPLDLFTRRCIRDRDWEVVEPKADAPEHHDRIAAQLDQARASSAFHAAPAHVADDAEQLRVRSKRESRSSSE